MVNLMKRKVFAEIAGKLFDSVNSNFGRIVQIIYNNGVEPTQHKLKNGVTTYVTGTAGDQDGLRHDHKRRGHEKRELKR